MTTTAGLMGSAVPPGQALQTTAGAPLRGQTSAGTTQANAYAIVDDFTVFTTVGASSGARLPLSAAPSLTSQAGDIYHVVNDSAVALLIYPGLGGRIIFNAAAVNASISLPANKTATFICLGTDVWAANVSS